MVSQGIAHYVSSWIVWTPDVVDVRISASYIPNGWLFSRKHGGEVENALSERIQSSQRLPGVIMENKGNVITQYCRLLC